MRCLFILLYGTIHLLPSFQISLYVLLFILGWCWLLTPLPTYILNSLVFSCCSLGICIYLCLSFIFKCLTFNGTSICSYNGVVVIPTKKATIIKCFFCTMLLCSCCWLNFFFLLRLTPVFFARNLSGNKFLTFSCRQKGYTLHKCACFTHNYFFFSKHTYMCTHISTILFTFMHIRHFLIPLPTIRMQKTHFSSFTP